MLVLRFIFLLLVLLQLSHVSHAQQFIKYRKTTPTPNDLQKQAEQYAKSKLKKLNRFAAQEERRTQRLLNKLKRKEKSLYYSLKSRDSLKATMATQGISIDSLSRIPSAQALSKGKHQLTQSLDSVKLLLQVAKNKTNQLNNLTTKANQQIPELKAIADLENKLNYNQYLQSGIQTRIGSLSQLCKGLTGIKAIGSMQKKVFYHQEQLKNLKSTAIAPKRIEALALQKLQSIAGVEEGLSQSATAANPMSKATSAEDLERMGYQTKRQVNKQLSKQIGTPQSKQLEQVNAKVKEQTASFQKAKQSLASTEKPSFKLNPMRGLPLKQRIEKSLTWQMYRPQASTPAIVEINVQAGLKHTPSLTYSLIAGAQLGLGTSFRHVRLSNEGLRIGANADWKWIWGISAQAGYERLYKSYTSTIVRSGENQVPNQVLTQTHRYRDIAYTGLQKTYNLHSKFKGTMLLAYDWLWKQGNARSPIIWRLGWKK